MSNRRAEQRKHALQMHVAEPFAAYLARQGILLTDLEAGNGKRGEPDVVSESQHERVGIEVTTLYFSLQAAKNRREMVEGHPERSTQHFAPGGDIRSSMIRSSQALRWSKQDRVNREKEGRQNTEPHDLSDKLLLRAKEQLVEKCRKAYSIPTYLLLDASTNGIITARYGPQIVRRLRVPDPCPFRGVYFALTKNKSNQINFFELRPYGPHIQ